MSLLRMTGLIALAVVATTFQASARPAPAQKAEPAPQDSPARKTRPVQKVSRQDKKPELVLVISPHTSAWSDSGPHAMLDGSGPAPTPGLKEFNSPVEGYEHAPAVRSAENGVLLSPLTASREWLAAHYPHAPPA